jgi:hypothetical protein
MKAIADFLTEIKPAPVLRDHILGLGYSKTAFREALRHLDVEARKDGSMWWYVPGPEITLRHVLREEETKEKKRKKKRARTDRQMDDPSPQVPASQSDDLEDDGEDLENYRPWETLPDLYANGNDGAPLPEWGMKRKW